MLVTRHKRVKRQKRRYSNRFKQKKGFDVGYAVVNPPVLKYRFFYLRCRIATKNNQTRIAYVSK